MALFDGLRGVGRRGISIDTRRNQSFGRVWNRRRVLVVGKRALGRVKQCRSCLGLLLFHGVANAVDIWRVQILWRRFENRRWLHEIGEMLIVAATCFLNLPQFPNFVVCYQPG